MSFHVPATVGLCLMIVTVGVAVKDQPDQTERSDDQALKVVEETPVGQDSGHGVLSLRQDGAWVVAFDDADRELVFFPRLETGNFPEGAREFTGLIDLILDGTDLFASVLTDDETYYEGHLELSNDQAKTLAPSLGALAVQCGAQWTCPPGKLPPDPACDFSCSGNCTGNRVCGLVCLPLPEGGWSCRCGCVRAPR